MKKTVTIFLLCLYTLAAFGATVHAHYCTGRLISYTLLPGRQRVCSNCGMPKEKSHGCCHDEERTVQLHADHQLNPNVITLQAFFQTGLAVQVVYFQKPGLPCAVIALAVSHAPPIYPPQKLYLQNRVLLI